MCVCRWTKSGTNLIRLPYQKRCTGENPQRTEQTEQNKTKQIQINNALNQQD